MPKIITERIIDRGYSKVGLSETQVQALITTSVEPTMTVTPTTNISVSGIAGGTFTGSQIYTLTNTGAVALTWTIIKSQDWLDLSASTGTLAIWASTTVTVSIDETEAALLVAGEYIDMLIFNAVAS